MSNIHRLIVGSLITIHVKWYSSLCIISPEPGFNVCVLEGNNDGMEQFFFYFLFFVFVVLLKNDEFGVLIL